MSEYKFDYKNITVQEFKDKLNFTLYLLEKFERNAKDFSDIWSQHAKDNEAYHGSAYPYAEYTRADMNRYRVLLNRAMKELCEYSYGRVKK